VGILGESLARITAEHAVPVGMSAVLTALAVVTALTGACRFPGLNRTGTAQGEPAAMEDDAEPAVSGEDEEGPTGAAELTVILLPCPFGVSPCRRTEE
jgi:hypothetical protein